MGQLSKQNQIIVEALLDLEITELQVFGFKKPELAFTLKILPDNLCVTIDDKWADLLSQTNLDAAYAAQNPERKELKKMKEIHQKMKSESHNFDVSVNEFYTSVIGIIDRPDRTHSYNIWIKTHIHLENLPPSLRKHFNNEKEEVQLSEIRKFLLEAKGRLDSPTIEAPTTESSPLLPTYKLQKQTYLTPLILQGPPGTGKTYGVEQYIKYILEKNEDAKDIEIENYRFTKLQGQIDTDNPPPVIWEIIQAHPSFSYEDFVRGMTTKSVDGLHFVAKDRILVQMAKEAKDLFKEYGDKSPKFILLIDEINRCNLSTVLGECILLLEPSKRMRMKEGKLHLGTPVRLQYEKENTDENTLVLPQNLEIIGTMNTADRSIALIDYAIRRRFRFISCKPNKPTLPLLLSQIGEEREMDDVLEEVYNRHPMRERLTLDIFTSINEHLNDTHQLGHSFFIVEEREDEKWKKEFKDKIRYEVIPLLREYKEDFSAWSNFSEQKYKSLMTKLNREIVITNTTQNSDTTSLKTTNNQREITESSDE